MEKNIGFIAIIFLSSNFLFSQNDVVIDKLKGPGQSIVLVNSSGVLSRANKFDATDEYSISPLDFRDSPQPIRNVNGRSEFHAPIHLPDASKMRSVTFWYEDNTPANLIFEIFRQDNTLKTIILTQQVSGTPGVPTSIVIDLGEFPVALIDNKNYYYYMHIACIDAGGVLAPWPEELVFYRASITYDY